MTNQQKLRAWLKDRGMKQNHFAEKVGVTQERVCKWLAGKSAPIPHFRQRVEELTGGEVKAEDW